MTGTHALFIFNELGQQMHPQQLASDDHHFIINAASWPAGIYILKVGNAQHPVETEKFVLVK